MLGIKAIQAPHKVDGGGRKSLQNNEMAVSRS